MKQERYCNRGGTFPPFFIRQKGRGMQGDRPDLVRNSDGFRIFRAVNFTPKKEFVRGGAALDQGKGKEFTPRTAEDVHPGYDRHSPLSFRLRMKNNVFLMLPINLILYPSALPSKAGGNPVCHAEEIIIPVMSHNSVEVYSTQGGEKRTNPHGYNDWRMGKKR